MINPEIIELINKAEKIVCIAHKGPDGDAVGSTVALSTFFKKMGKKSQVVLPNKVPDYLAFLPYSDLVINGDSMEIMSEMEITNADLIFCLDFNHPSRVGNLEKFLLKAKGKKIMIDHHLNPSDFCDHVLSKPEVSSTCQLVYDFMKEIKEENIYSEDIMQCIYTGIVTDTGSFRFSSVDANTHYIAQKFIENGFKHEIIHREIFDQNKLNRLQLMGYCIHKKIEILKEEKVGVLSVTQNELKEFGCNKSDTEGFVNMVLSIIGVEVALFLIEQDTLVKLSLRSIGNWHVNEIMNNHFNGGGHKNAAGGQFEGTIDQAILYFKENVIPEISTYNHA